MSYPHASRIRRAAAPVASAVLVLALSACLPAPAPAGPTASHGTGNAVPSAHIHSLAVNGATNQVLVATHDGLFDLTEQPATKIGPSNDLMGFTAGQEEGVYYASGHPGEGSDLPDPLGLLRSRDGGNSWEQLSRQGESDFHALTTTKSGIVAFDGTLRTSKDGKNWTAVATDFEPAVLAGSPHSDTVLATTPGGIRRSTDGGNTWLSVQSGPVIQFAAFASPTEAFGVEPDGAVHYSGDGGTSWTRKGRIDGEVQAIAAAKGVDGKPWIWAATIEGIVVSADGEMFRPAGA
jgi:photosystem II stability/assembly factor-like uncharacterized protein